MKTYLSDISENIVLITGATGFVGLNLQEYLLADGMKIRPLSVRFVKDQQIDCDADHIVHLAGKAHDLKNVSSVEDYYDANFELTKQLVDSFLKSRARTFIYLSSVKAVADKADGILNEDCEPAPATHYGKSKLQAEEYIKSQLSSTDKTFYILRPCMIHGKYNKGNLNLLYSFVKRGIPYPLGSFQNKRSLLSIENLCFVINHLIKSTTVIPSGIYNVADTDPISTNKIIEIISEQLHKKNKIFKVNKTLIWFLARVGDNLGLPLNSERLQKMTESYLVDNSKIRSYLDSDLPISTENGLISTIKYF